MKEILLINVFKFIKQKKIKLLIGGIIKKIIIKKIKKVKNL